MTGTSNESCPVAHDLSQDFTLNTNTQSKSKSIDRPPHTLFHFTVKVVSSLTYKKYFQATIWISPQVPKSICFFLEMTTVVFTKRSICNSWIWKQSKKRKQLLPFAKHIYPSHLNLSCLPLCCSTHNTVLSNFSGANPSSPLCASLSQPTHYLLLHFQQNLSNILIKPSTVGRQPSHPAPAYKCCMCHSLLSHSV